MRLFLLVFLILFSSSTFALKKTAVDQRLDDLKLTLPAPKKPIGKYAQVKRSGMWVFISGQLPFDEKDKIITGTIGRDLTVDKGKHAAKCCILQMISQLKDFYPDLDAMKCINLNIFVRSEPNFTDQDLIGQEASDLIAKIFGQPSTPTLTSIGVTSLPQGATVAIQGIFKFQSNSKL